MKNPYFQHLAVFFITLIVDVFWSRYTIYVSERKALPAAFWSMAIVLGGTLSTAIWLENRWVLVSSAAGAFVGTFLSVRRGKSDAEA